jgi:hypothetical protein
MRTRLAGTALLLAAFAVAPARADIRNGPFLQQVTTNSVFVCWTATRPEPGSVSFGPSQQLGQTRASPKALSHMVRLTGLSPGARYYYRVESGEAKTQVFDFLTAPKPGTSFSFVVYGDIKGAPKHEEVIARIVELNPALVVTTGDLVEDGRRRELWDLYFKQAAPSLARAPTYPLLGNHELDSRFYFRLFALPLPGRYYSFDYGDAHFIILDSNPPYRTSAAQRKWLEADLERHRRSPYILVFLHHPLYTCTAWESRREEAAAVRRAFEDIFTRYQVSIVFAGHDHNYQHNYAKGIHYVVTGGGGAELYPVSPLEFTRQAQMTHHVVEVQASPGRLLLRAILPDGEVIDTWETGPRARAETSGR